ncbi:MAG: VWA domain-containing protein [Nannocystaceae bacterium]|nr:VWA domain-containing protein [Nannocystaceae bacterium]
MAGTVNRAAAVLLGFAVLACGDDSNEFEFATMGQGSAAGRDDGTATSGTTGEGSGETANEPTQGEGSTTMGVDADDDDDGTASGSGSPTGTDDGELPVVPCIGMDILFVVDNSATMIEEQTRISSSAAAWLMTVNASTASAVNNVNVGVITTDESAMVTATAMPCNFVSGQSYMQMGGALFDPVVFAAEVQCALSVGVAGSSDERPMEHLIEALSPQFVDGGPNTGFLREGALLVIVILTDEEDDFEAKTAWGSAGDPADWISDIAALKGDIHRDVVVLSLIGVDQPNACPNPQWNGMAGAELSPRLAEFAEGFPAGATQDLCAPEFNTFLSGVVPGIAGSCMNFSPP